MWSVAGELFLRILDYRAESRGHAGGGWRAVWSTFHGIRFFVFEPMPGNGRHPIKHSSSAPRKNCKSSDLEHPMKYGISGFERVCKSRDSVYEKGAAPDRIQ